MGLGDNINLYFSDYSFNYTVTRIYEIDNSYVLNDGVAMIEIDDILNQHFITSDYTYAGAYITLKPKFPLKPHPIFMIINL